jgi:hypothetical protein
MPPSGKRDFTAEMNLAKRKGKKGGDSALGKNERRSRERGDWIKTSGYVR